MEIVNYKNWSKDIAHFLNLMSRRQIKLKTIQL